MKLLHGCTTDRFTATFVAGASTNFWRMVHIIATSLFKPGRSLRIFRAKKFLSTPSFGGVGKPSVPCYSFAAKFTWKSECRQNYYRTSLSPTVPPFAARMSRVVADGGTWRLKWERLGVGGKQWQTTPKNLPRMQCAGSIPVT